MKSFIKIGIIILFSLSCFNSSADPGIGLVKDSKGFIYYTDLTQVWKVDPLSGKKESVVRGVHTHELFIDANDNLYGEHLWYNGEQLNTWGHYVWSLRSNGKLDTIIKPSEGFLENYSFVRDAAGNMYSVRRFKGVSRIQKITPAGDVITLTEHNFRHIGWIHATSEGTIYFIDSVNLNKIEKGELKVVAPKPKGDDPYSIWLDAQENIYLAIMGEKIVKKVSQNGAVTAMAHSPGDWMPTSGIFDNRGNMWLLETTITNEVRVRKVDKESAALISPVNKSNTFLWAVILGVLLIAIYFIARRRYKRQNSKQITP